MNKCALGLYVLRFRKDRFYLLYLMRDAVALEGGGRGD